jgi:hypothetical protein
LCDVFSPSPKVKYIPLPIKPYRGRCNPDLHLRGNLAAHRSVCVTSRGGGIKFVDVTPSHSWLSGRIHEYYEDSEDEDEISMLPSAVSSWTLVGESWVKDGEISKYNPMFACLTSYDPRFASLSKYNPGARGLFDSGVFYHFSQFRDFVLYFASPNHVKRQFCP